MKFQIKTLNQKSLVVDFEDTKTVYELKKELSLYPDIGVRPELQKLIYAGKILCNGDVLSTYNIDAKKFLVIMILKHPIEEPVLKEEEKKVTETKEEAAAAAATVSTPNKEKPKEQAEAEFKTPTAPVSKDKVNSKEDAMVQQIVSMGYPEHDVRRALTASFNNPERAIEYLIEGIPSSPLTPEGGDSYTDSDADISLTPFEVFRGDPTFQSLRAAIQQHPELIDAAIQRIGEANPALLNLISENQQEFLSLLINGSDDEEDDDEEDDDDDGMNMS